MENVEEKKETDVEEKKETDVEEKIEIQRVTEFKQGDKPFHSSGFSKIKVTKAGKVVLMEIPIQSTGISELMDALANKAPAPPPANVLLDPEDKTNSMVADYGITRKQWVKIPDYSNEEYIKSTGTHHRDIGIAIMLKGLSIEIRDTKGDIISDPDRKVEILKDMGMSTSHFGQMSEDIQNLTEWTEEEREHFLN